MKHHHCYVVLLLIALAAIGLHQVAGQESSNVAPLKIGQSIPEIEAFSVEGMPVSFHAPKDKVLLIQFWNTEAGSSENQVKKDIRLYRRFHDHGLNVVSVCTDTNEDRIVSFSNRWQIPWPQLMDEDVDEGNPTDRLNIPGVPFNLLVDENGVIQAIDLKGEGAHTAVAEALNLSLDEIPMPEEPTPRSDGRSTGMIMGGMGIAAPARSSPTLLGTAEEREEAEPCKKNLRKISMALTEYRHDHDNELPKWLSDLFPEYLQDKSVLLCPTNPVKQTFMPNMADPELPCSYTYEFAPSSREWKTEQLSEYGDKVAMVRCVNHRRPLSLSYGGEIYFTDEIIWENSFEQGRSLNDLDARVRKQLRRLGVALLEYREKNGDNPQELQDLYPEYIKDESLLQPLDSYALVYEFSSKIMHSDGRTYREWKTDQLNEFGDYVPIVRAMGVQVGGKTTNISLAYTGEIFESQAIWEDFLRQAQPSEPTATIATRPSRQAQSAPSPVLGYQLETRLFGPFELNEMPLKQLVDNIQTRTDCVFMLETSENPKVTASLLNPTVEELLDTILPKHGLAYWIHPDARPHPRDQRQTVRPIVIGSEQEIEAAKRAQRTQLRATVSRVYADMRSLQTALKMFEVDTGQYLFPRGNGEIDEAYLEREDKNGKKSKWNLTTPVAYIRNYPKDPFNPKEGSFRYHSDGNSWFILASPGPDRSVDLDITKFNPGSGFGRKLLMQAAYDPSNGMLSGGDLLRIEHEQAGAEDLQPPAQMIRGMTSRVQAEQRMLASALESFFIDNNTYPLPLVGDRIDCAGIKIGRTPQGRYVRLTTPVAYISRIPADPFDFAGKAYRYFGNGNAWYILVSNGPDMKPDFDVTTYNPDEGVGRDQLLPFTYHPSNGLSSAGDIFHAGP